ncbi:WecB/TagA/CpsF family glycosyltransferase [Lentilactobacillus kosonis]|uniref:N-acetylglucosaminyldiphosphoundecaprenol N-acetyl-beta-D-mannosaminyltransferase n=1 Tax=Lentilactobacillus kosonis TaxID=2810561 RepID=A0A401FJP4_9LACO|nr:WecB/TagA/CpsF family glycosyltransferase [Lentilactobacillus kosonis]GAY72584.1 N-acetylmannosaminyltransferase [Lentilactobacillus kosonis]
MNQSTNIINILGVDFDNTTLDNFLDIVTKRITEHRRTFVVTANPEIVMYANSHSSFNTLIKAADFIIPDGIGIIIGSRIIANPLKERVTGYDVFIRLLKWGSTNGKSAFFVGAKPNVIKDLQKVVSKQYPGLTISGTQDGYYKDESSVSEAIRVASPDMVFVATGSPKQEEFINRNLNKSEALFMGVGGSFDVLTGNVKRAPKKWQDLHVEWLYRTLKEPSRFKRLMILPKYLIRVFEQRQQTKRH